jgi:hypothetical protein
VTEIALLILVAACLWLGAVAALMALRPSYCLHLFATMTVNLEASNWRLQLIEQGLRVIAGLALVARAPDSKLPLAFDVGGWVLVASSVAILMLPIRWHGRFGAFWVQRLTAPAIRVLSPVPALLAAGLIYAAI